MFNKSSALLRPVLLILCFQAMIVSCHAILIAYEGFDYDVGSLAGGQGGSGTEGWMTQSWFVTNAASGNQGVESPGLEFPGVAGQGNSFHMSDSRTPSGIIPPSLRLTRNLGATYGNSSPGTIWISFLASSTTTWDGLYLGPGQPNASNLGVVNSSYVNTEGVGWGGTAGGQAISTPSTLSFILSRIDFYETGGYAQKVWVNPNLETIDPLANVQSYGGVVVSTNSYNFDQLTISTGLFTGSLLIDEIRIGTTLQDVTAVPEPSPLFCLMGFSSICLLSRMFHRRLRINNAHAL